MPRALWLPPSRKTRAHSWCSEKLLDDVPPIRRRYNAEALCSHIADNIDPRDTRAFGTSDNES